MFGSETLTVNYSAIFNSGSDSNNAVSQPVLQCVQVKPLAGQQGGPERFRVVFSDINNFVQSMLATRKQSREVTIEVVNGISDKIQR